MLPICSVEKVHKPVTEVYNYILLFFDTFMTSNFLNTHTRLHVPCTKNTDQRIKARLDCQFYAFEKNVVPP